METSDQKRKPTAKGPATDKGAGGGVAGKRDKFQLPPGYESAYLGSGKSFSTDEVDFARLRAGGEIEKEAAGDPDLVKAYGAWLWDEEGLAQLVGQKDKPLPKEEKAAALEKLARLTPFDREALDRFFGSLGVMEKFARVLGPEGLAQLGKGAPPAPENEDEDKKEDKKDDPRQESADTDDGARQREAKGRFEGGTLFDKLFKTPLEKKKLDDPAPVLEKVEALTERGFDELAQVIDRQQAWEPLQQVLGARFIELVGRLRHQPLARALARFPDGVCDPGERTLLLSQLARLGPFEERALKAVIEERGTGNALANLLGPELQLWLSGGALIADKREPDEEPEAALAAARALSPPTQRRLAELVTAGAVGPALLEALGAESEPFVRGYWEAVTRPDREQKDSPKLPLRALGKIQAAQLRLLAWCGERKGQEPASLDAGAGATQFDALLRPLLEGAVVSPETKKKTLEALRSLSLAELKDLFAQLSTDGTAALEALLGAEFAQLVGERFYRPLDDAQKASPDERELPEAEKDKYLGRLRDLDEYPRARLQAEVTERATGPRLGELFGRELQRKKALDDDFVARNAPPRKRKPRADDEPELEETEEPARDTTMETGVEEKVVKDGGKEEK